MYGLAPSPGGPQEGSANADGSRLPLQEDGKENVIRATTPDTADTTFYLPSDLKDAYQKLYGGQVEVSGELLRGAAYHVLDLPVKPTIESIDERLETLRKDAKIAIVGRHYLALNIDKSNFHVTLQNLIEAGQGIARTAASGGYDLVAGLTMLFNVVEKVGYESLSTECDQHSFAFAILSVRGTSITLAVSMFVHRAAEAEKKASFGILGGQSGKDRMNCQQCFYQIIIYQKSLIPSIAALLFDNK